MKRFFEWVFYGIAITLGSVLTMKTIEMARDPHKRASIKRNLNNIKNDFSKTES